MVKYGFAGAVVSEVFQVHQEARPGVGALALRPVSGVDLLNQTPIAPSSAVQMPNRRVYIDPPSRLVAGRARTSLPHAISFLPAYGISPGVLIEAIALAAMQGVRPEVALMATGRISEEDYFRALSRHLGLRFISGGARLASGTLFPETLQAGVAPLQSAPEDGPAWLIAPSGRRLDELLTLHRRGTLPRERFAITAPSFLRRMLQDHDGPCIAEMAANDLRTWRPDLSAHTPVSGSQKLALAAIVLLFSISLFASGLLWLLISLLAGSILAGSIVLRLFAAAGSCDPLFAMPDADTAAGSPPDADLPVFTIIVALYREARVVQKLVAALDAIDYPALCIKSTKPV